MNFIYDRNEYVASTWTLEHMSLYEALTAFDQYGFKNVEIWSDTVHLDPRNAMDIAEVRGWIKKFGMNVHSLHAPFRNYNVRPADDSAFCRMRTENIKKTVDYAQELDCGILVVHAIDRHEYNYLMSQLSIVQDYIGEITLYAAKRGVQIAIEDIPPGDGPDEIYTSLENQKRLFENLGIKFCLDIGHVPLLGADMFREIDAAGSDLITLHVHNNSGKTDDHNLPTDGTLDRPRIHNYIRKNGYKGEFVLEIYGGADKESEFAVLDRMSALFEA